MPSIIPHETENSIDINKKQLHIMKKNYLFLLLWLVAAVMAIPVSTATGNTTSSATSNAGQGVSEAVGQAMSQMGAAQPISNESFKKPQSSLECIRSIMDRLLCSKVPPFRQKGRCEHGSAPFWEMDMRSPKHLDRSQSLPRRFFKL